MQITNHTTQPTGQPTTQPTGQPGQVIAKPNIPILSSTGSVPAPVSSIPNFVQRNADMAAAQNSLVNANTGRNVVGGKKRSKAKRTKAKKAKRTKSKKAKRTKSKRTKRTRRGGATSPTPSPTPSSTPNPTPTAKLVTVPQFLGAQHAGANQASINLNHGGMLMKSQSALDNINAPASNHSLP